MHWSLTNNRAGRRESWPSKATMVRFNERLQANIVPEWTDSYVDYDKLKKLIGVREGGQAREVLHESLLQAALLEGPFLSGIREEAAKVDKFYSDYLVICQRKWGDLRPRIVAVSYAQLPEHEGELRETECRDLYREVTQLRNFCIVNYTGARDPRVPCGAAHTSHARRGGGAVWDIPPQDS